MQAATEFMLQTLALVGATGAVLLAVLLIVLLASLFFTGILSVLFDGPPDLTGLGLMGFPYLPPPPPLPPPPAIELLRATITDEKGNDEK
jgi:hypothetical protein